MPIGELGICGIAERRVRANQQLVCGFTNRLDGDCFFRGLDGQRYFAVPEEHFAAALQRTHQNAAHPLALRVHPRATLAGEKRTAGDVVCDR